MKGSKAEKISIDKLSEETMDIISEMLSIICCRTGMDPNEREFTHTGCELKYFGIGHQLKISKLADTLYSTMRDLLVFVMSELAKESDVDCKFQLPKHTSFVGTIVKSVAIDVLSANEIYRQYLDQLCNTKGKFVFNPENEMFLNIYRDVVLLLEERGFLFEDDPELLAVKQARGFQPNFPIPQTTPVIEGIPLPAEEVITNVQSSTFAPITIKPESQSVREDDPEVMGDMEYIKTNSRNRIIFPYLRRLFESHKSVIVTRKRVLNNIPLAHPDEEIKQVFNNKYNEELMNSQDPNSSPEFLRDHCIFVTLTFLREHFPKERVDILEQFIKEEKTLSGKTRKRYAKIPSGKRLRYQDVSKNEYAMVMPAELGHPDQIIPMM